MTTQTVNKIRFKFMPTPNGSLHVGHAWLLLVTKSLADQASRAGYDADIVLVIDGIIGLSWGFPQDQIQQTTDRIIDDAAWLGVQFADVVSNSDFPCRSEFRFGGHHFVSGADVTHPALCPSYLENFMKGTPYFIQNCLVDAALGVSHIIRGADQLAKFGTYLVFYELLGIEAPQLVYVPLVNNQDGSKIATGAGCALEDVRDRVDRDSLCSLLATCCLCAPQGEAMTAGGEKSFEQQVAGDDWDWILAGKDRPAKLRSFLARLNPFPRLANEWPARQLIEN